MVLLRFHIRKILGPKLVVRINPRCISHHVGTNSPYTIKLKAGLHAIEASVPKVRFATRFAQKIAYSVEPFPLPDFAFNNLIPIEQDLRYRLIEDLVKYRTTIEDSLWFARLLQELEATGTSRHKQMIFLERSEIINFLKSYALGLIRSLETVGYDETAAPDIGTAFIDRMGAIVKSDAGNHRFAAARVLKLPLVPLEILGIHSRFLKLNAEGHGLEDINRMIRAIEAQNQSCDINCTVSIGNTNS